MLVLRVDRWYPLNVQPPAVAEASCIPRFHCLYPWYHYKNPKNTTPVALAVDLLTPNFPGTSWGVPLQLLQPHHWAPAWALVPAGVLRRPGEGELGSVPLRCNSVWCVRCYCRRGTRTSLKIGGRVEGWQFPRTVEVRPASLSFLGCEPLGNWVLNYDHNHYDTTKNWKAAAGPRYIAG